MDKWHMKNRKFRDSSDRGIRGQENFSVNSSTREDVTINSTRTVRIENTPIGTLLQELYRRLLDQTPRDQVHVLDSVRLADIKSIPLFTTNNGDIRYQVHYDLNRDPIAEHPA